MSKVDAQRALREARWAASGPPRAPRPPLRPAAVRPDPIDPDAPVPFSTATVVPGPVVPAVGAPAVSAAVLDAPVLNAISDPMPALAIDPAPAGGALCGHRAIGGKSCQREAGHPEKNHRYK